MQSTTSVSSWLECAMPYTFSLRSFSPRLSPFAIMVDSLYPCLSVAVKDVSVAVCFGFYPMSWNHCSIGNPCALCPSPTSLNTRAYKCCIPLTDWNISGCFSYTFLLVTTNSKYILNELSRDTAWCADMLSPATLFLLLTVHSFHLSVGNNRKLQIWNVF